LYPVALGYPSRIEVKASARTGTSTRTAGRAGRAPFDVVRRLGFALPGVEEGTSYGTPALRVRGKLLARLREDGETLVVRTDAVERDVLMQLDPGTYFITDHYREYPWVLVRLSTVPRGQLADLLRRAWRRVAPARLAEGGPVARAGRRSAASRPRRRPVRR
jgi:hypothetical protein